jgi:hypothetical protein
VDLDESEDVFFSRTLLPYYWRQWILPGSTVYLPKAIDYYRQREPVFDRYLQILFPPLKLYPGSQDTISRDKLPTIFVADPSDRLELAERTLSRGLWFQPLQGPGSSVSESK